MALYLVKRGRGWKPCRFDDTQSNQLLLHRLLCAIAGEVLSSGLLNYFSGVLMSEVPDTVWIICIDFIKQRKKEKKQNERKKREERKKMKKERMEGRKRERKKERKRERERKKEREKERKIERKKEG